MLLLYQWYLTDSYRLKDMSAPIMNFQIYTFKIDENSSGDAEQNVVTLFQNSAEHRPIVPQRPGGFDTSDNALAVRSSYNRQSTFYFTLSVDDNSATSVAVSFLFVFVA